MLEESLQEGVRFLARSSKTGCGCPQSAQNCVLIELVDLPSGFLPKTRAGRSNVEAGLQSQVWYIHQLCRFCCIPTKDFATNHAHTRTPNCSGSRRSFMVHLMPESATVGGNPLHFWPRMASYWPHYFTMIKVTPVQWWVKGKQPNP